MSDIENIKSKLDIVDVVSRYVDLKSAGQNMKGLCPFHQEKSPSFMVNPGLQIYKCFGCGKGGDVLNFLQEVERLDFPEALQMAAELAGVELTGKVHKKDAALEEKKHRMYSANKLTADFFHHLLMRHKIGKSALEYSLETRQLTSEVLQKFLYGYAPDGYENLKLFLLKKNFTEKELVEFGLLVERDGRTIDKFRNRLMQPIFDLKDNVIGFSGRYLGDFKGAPKYLNSAESLIYRKNETLYGLSHAKDSIRKERFVILVEGNIDIASSHKVGVENIAAPLGTSFTPNQARLLKRYADQVYFAFDTDTAGIHAIIRGLKILEDIGLNHKVIDLGEYGDVDDVIRAEPKLWPRLIDNAVDTVEYLQKALGKTLDLGSVDGKNAFKQAILPVLKSLKNEIRRNHHLKEISLILEIPQESLVRDVESSNAPRVVEPQQAADTTTKESNSDNALEKYFLSLLINLNQWDHIYFEEHIFRNDLCKRLYIEMKKRKRMLGSDDLKEMSNDIRKLYEELVLTDTDTLNLDLEIEHVHTRLQRMFIKHEILHVRSQLAIDSENIDLLKKLKELLQELQEVS